MYVYIYIYRVLDLHMTKYINILYITHITIIIII